MHEDPQPGRLGQDPRHLQLLRLRLLLHAHRRDSSSTPTRSAPTTSPGVDKDKCVACGQCVENCPVNALQLGQKVCSSKPWWRRLSPQRDPRDQVDQRPLERGLPDNRQKRCPGHGPCKTACPATLPCRGYIKLAAQGKYTEALELIKREPLPAVCGRICTAAASRPAPGIDAPIAIDEIKNSSPTGPGPRASSSSAKALRSGQEHRGGGGRPARALLRLLSGHRRLP